MTYDRTVINLQEDHELNGWLSRNGYRETEDNRKKLISIINKLKNNSSEHYKWDNLNDVHKNQPELFLELERK